MELIINYIMVGVLIVGVLSTGSWQYLLYQRLKNSDQKTTIENVRKLPQNDKARQNILLLKKIGDVGIGAYLLWFLITLIMNLSSS